MEKLEFPELATSELAACARQTAADLGLSIPDGYFPTILENLIVLQSHAAILDAALKAAGRQSFRPAVR